MLNFSLREENGLAQYETHFQRNHFSPVTIADLAKYGDVVGVLQVEQDNS
jgi:hypothetical protein